MFRLRKMHWLLGAMLVCLLALVWFTNKPDATLAEKIAGVVGVGVVWAILMLLFFLVWKVITRLTGGRFRGSVGPHVFEIAEDTFVESNAQGRQELKVAGLRRVAETGSHFFVITNAGTGYVIPKRDVQNYDALYALQKRVAAGGA